MLEQWVLDIRNQCQKARVPFFFKQWGGVQKSRAGRSLDGRTWDEMPSSAVSAERTFVLSFRFRKRGGFAGYGDLC
jgi:hypothetical protein